MTKSLVMYLKVKLIVENIVPSDCIQLRTCVESSHKYILKTVVVGLVLHFDRYYFQITTSSTTKAWPGILIKEYPE
jgi:hypothetical protein